MIALSRVSVLLVCLGALHPAPILAAETPESSYVLIVAANRSLDPGVRPLRFADDDGARYYELFARARPARIALLAVLDADTARVHPVAASAARVPWMRALREEVSAIARAVEEDQRHGRRTRFTFVYIGHGNVAKDGEGYVSLQDVRLRRRDLFREVVDAIPAGVVHLVIDACKSYFLVARGPDEWRDDRSRSYGGEVRAFLGQASLEANPQVGAIVSTSGDEEVHEWSALRSGVFSHELRSALAGAADLNGDGKIEYSEIGAFIAAANQRVSHQRARIRPYLHPPTADRRAALFEPGRARGAQLELAPSLGGRLSIEDGRGVRVVDLHKALGGRLRIALADDQRHFVRHGDREAVLPAGRSGVTRFASLRQEPVRADVRGALDAAYRDELFALPLSRSFYEGYLATADLPSISFRESLGDSVDPPLRGRLGLDLELGYALSTPPLKLLEGPEHSLTLGAAYAVRGPLYLSLRLELGGSRHLGPAGDYSLLRLALLGGAGLRFALTRWLGLALEANGGYQALFQLGEENSDPAGGKLGISLGLRIRPFPLSHELALVLRGGLYGHLARVAGTLDVRARPEGGIALSWGF